ncbi:sphingosine N-acyltransferase LAG1 [Parachaetomium inaequale]|uniref:Sphingosine N-acyltransferase LAG1 n=1 Tax=Parachaetomium inaequale TaxID=2588326 RepID=A0AAN6PDL0_9PEZI|nr:sphingosine N-acyltransferase LAG1 [Parachaetomium inaequale]
MPATEALSLLRTSTSPLEATTPNGRSSRRRAKLNPRGPLSVSRSDTRPGELARQDKPSRLRKRSRAPPRGLLRRTWALPLALVLGFVALYAVNPTESNIVHHFLFLSYKIDRHDGQYGKGRWDLAFVGFYTIFLTFTREFIMQEVLRPLARLGGIQSRGKQARFMEQMYTACYFAFAGPLGLYTMKQTPGLWYFETRAMHETYPNIAHAAVFKFYYLFQAAYWVQQAIVMVLGQEKPRKDFRELIAHHVITITLIFLSYRFHFAYIGIGVYITHDVSDFFLAISKSLNYLNHPAQSSSFALCIAAWIYLRHYLNLGILYSIATEYSAVGPFELDWAAQAYKCRVAQVGTFALLAALQALNLFWLYCLFRSAYRFVVLGVAKDDRSEDEEEVVLWQGLSR